MKHRPPCELCGLPADRHEWVTRGAGGPREPWNQADLCRFHHGEFHYLGRLTFARKYPVFEDRIRGACERLGKVFEKVGYYSHGA